MLPKQIEPCPIHETVVEVRFESQLPPDAIFGVVYDKLKDIFPDEVKSLPILQIPEAVRNADPNLINQPHYRMEKDGFIAQIGPRIFSLSQIDSYTTWQVFLHHFQRVFEKIDSTNLIAKISRLGLRYINSFEAEILSRLNVDVQIIGERVVENELFLRTVLNKDPFKAILQIANQAELTRRDGPTKTASVIDIDTVFVKAEILASSEIDELLGAAHEIEKELFFGLLKSDFLESLNPTY